MLDDGNQLKGTVDGHDDGIVTLLIDEFAHDAQDPVGVISADFSDFA